MSKGTMDVVLPLHIYQREGGSHVSNQLMRGIFKDLLFELQDTRNAPSTTRMHCSMNKCRYCMTHTGHSRPEVEKAAEKEEREVSNNL